jgi:hypothetical protein
MIPTTKPIGTRSRATRIKTVVFTNFHLGMQRDGRQPIIHGFGYSVD